MEPITPAQIRGARGMLDWSVLDLARASSMSISTVKRIEDGGLGVSAAKMDLLRGALETAGMRFLADEGDGSGMRMQPRQASPVERFF